MAYKDIINNICGNIHTGLIDFDEPRSEASMPTQSSCAVLEVCQGFARYRHRCKRFFLRSSISVPLKWDELNINQIAPERGNNQVL